MVSALRGSRVLSARPALTLLTVLLVATSLGGCWSSPRFQAPFTLANPNERHPIAVRQGEVTLDLAVYPGSSGLNESQKDKVANFLADYKSQTSDRLLIRAPSGGPNETAAMRAYDQVRKAMRRADIDPRSVALEPYFGNGDPAAPVRLSYLQVVAVAPIAQTGRKISAAIRKTCLGPTWAARRNVILPLPLPMHATCSVRAARRRVQANAATTCGVNM